MPTEWVSGALRIRKHRKEVTRRGCPESRVVQRGENRNHRRRHIGGTLAKLFVDAGHEVAVSNSRGPRRWRASSRSWAAVCRGEEPVGPVFGVASRVGEDDGDAGVADLESGELVCEPVAVDVLEFEQRAVAGFDNDRGKREFGEPLELEGEGAVGER
jgi:hypothetical protein